MIIANMSMSLDGFIEDRDGDVPTELFRWQRAMSSASSTYFEDAVAGVGALVTGRTLFDVAQGWGGRHPTGAPVFVVTHEAPDGWPGFTFVTGVESAIAQAVTLAGEKTVAVASADIARQCLDLGLLDAIALDLVPVVLGAGKPWFAGVGAAVRLSDPEVIEGAGVTHLLYRVQR